MSTSQPRFAFTAWLPEAGAWSLYALQFILPPQALPILAALSALFPIVAALQRDPRALVSTLLAALLLGWNATVPFAPWPFPLAVPCIATLVAWRLIPALRHHATCLTRGAVSREALGLAAFAVALHVSGLLLAARVSSGPNATRALTPTLIAMLVAGGGCEELIFRGALADSCTRWLRSPALAIAVQSVLYALAHRFAQPGGALGMSLALADGLAFGACARASRGLGVPLLARCLAVLASLAIVSRLAA